MRFIIVLFAALVLSACVTTSTRALDSRTAIISGRGNAYTDMAAVQRRMVREAAEQTLAHGFTHFVIVGSNDQTHSFTWRTPKQTSYSGMVSGSCMGASCNGLYSGSSTTTGGQIFDFVEPGADMMVRFLHANEVAGSQTRVWDAADVLAATAK